MVPRWSCLPAQSNALTSGVYFGASWRGSPLPFAQFYDVENQATLKQTEHFRCNYIEWDPSGRYACTAVSQPVKGSHWKAQMDNGYQVFTFQASRPIEIEIRSVTGEVGS